MIRLLTLILAFVTPVITNASFIDSGPPTDSAGNWKFDLYDSSNNQRGTNTNPIRTDPTGTTTQPISGTVTANAGTNLNTSALATSANQTNGTQKAQRVDGSGNVAPAGDTAARASFVEITDGSVVLGTSSNPVRVDPTGTTTQPVNQLNQRATLLSSATIAANGSTSISLDIGANQWITFVVRIDNAPTGTTPTLRFTLNNLDATGNITGTGTQSSLFTSASTSQAFVHYAMTGRLQLNYVVTGTTPSFTGVSVSISTGSGSTVLRNSSSTEIGTSTNPVRTDPTGSTTQPVSGTVTANIGTTNGLALNTTVAAPQGSVSGGTAGTVSNLIGGIYNTSAPTLTNGQQAAFQFDVNGQLKTTATATLSGTVQVVGNVASAAADSGNPVKIGAIYNSSLPSLTSGNRVDLQTNKFGELVIVNRNKFTNIHGAATTTVKSGAGRIAALCYNGGTGSSSAVLYDNTAGSGTIIAQFSPSSGTPICMHYDADFATGLTVVTTVSATDLTITYQ